MRDFTRELRIGGGWRHIGGGGDADLGIKLVPAALPGLRAVSPHPQGFQGSHLNLSQRAAPYEVLNCIFFSIVNKKICEEIVKEM